MKKLIFLLIFVLSSFIISATEFTLVAKPGSLRVPGGLVSLVCKDSVKCFYELDFPDGDYFYESNDGDTCIITVNDTCPVIASNNNVTINQ